MYPPYGAPGMPSPTSNADDLTGTQRIKMGGLLGLLGLLLAIGGTLYLIVDVGFALGTISSGSAASVIQALEIGIALIVVGVILGLLSFVLYTMGFSSLRRNDRAFSAPFILCIIGLIGLLSILAFFAVFLDAAVMAVACGSTPTGTCVSNADSGVAGLFAIAALGGLLGFIGLIGAILGLWRFGSKWNSSMAKIGAILYIIPIASIIAPLLVFLGARDVEKRLLSPPPFMAPPMAPPMTPYPPMPPPPS
jgi:Protein of unknown function (DUF973)